MARKVFFAPKGPQPAGFMQAKALGPYEVCVKVMYTRHAYPTSLNGPVGPLFRMHTNVHFLSNASVTGNIGVVSFLKDHNSFAVKTLIKQKSDDECAITDVVEYFETHYAVRGFTKTRFCSGNGGEFNSHHVSEYCLCKGIVQEF